MRFEANPWYANLSANSTTIKKEIINNYLRIGGRLEMGVGGNLHMMKMAAFQPPFLEVVWWMRELVLLLLGLSAMIWFWFWSFVWVSNWNM